MKTQVILTGDDLVHKKYKKGETGYIDGYCVGGNGKPYLFVVVGDHIIMCGNNEVKVTGLLNK